VLRRGIDRPLHDHILRRGQWKRLSAILVNSDATGATVRRSLPWFPEDRIRRIYNPVRFTPRPPIPPTGGTVRVVAVGRLVRQKGHDVLLKALSLLGDDLPLDLVIAGDGKLRGRLERDARRRGLTDRCRFTGEVEDPAEVYAAADLVVIPSRYEGFGFVAAEAALAGLPVVASDVSSLRELVRDGETGRLVPPEDAAALAAALKELAEDRARASAMGRAARTLARERFDPDRLLSELVDFLSRAAGLGPAGAP
jgi:glycosyltransferase involved in cell wall biosynthesis